ncbi:RimK/LysX family protein [Paracoccaceae bacterium GXU_MW_L88]
MPRRFTLGWQEWVSLPDLGLPAVLAKVDTGARTSALHAYNITPIEGTEGNRVAFSFHPDPDQPDLELHCEADVVDRREVISSNGVPELRYVISTDLAIGGERWPIEVTLTDRGSMAYRMLLGRTGMPEGVVVAPATAFNQPKLGFDAYEDAPRTDAARSLSLAILTQAPKGRSTRRLVDAAEARGHEVRLIDTARCYMNIRTAQAEVHYDGAPLPPLDAVIPRIGSSIARYGAAVVRQFQTTGSYTLNGPTGILAARNPLLAHQLLARYHVAMPHTAFARSPQDSDNLVHLVGEGPRMIRLLEGEAGHSDVFADSDKAAISVVNAFGGLGADFLVQDYVADMEGGLVRAIVLGGKLVGALRYQPAGKGRAALRQGGVKLTREERDMAQRAATALGLDLAGIDLVRTEDGPKVVDVTCSPSLRGIDGETDLADLVIAHIEAQLAPTLRRAGRKVKA